LDPEFDTPVIFIEAHVLCVLFSLVKVGRRNFYRGDGSHVLNDCG
jgi:hypothetical protein